MKLLVLNEHDVHELLTMRECIRVMEEALADLARGKVTNPLRSMIRGENANGILGLMPSHRGDYGLKEICVSPNAFTVTALTIRIGAAKSCACFASKTKCIISLWNFLAVNSNASRWRVPWSIDPRLCLQTNLPEISTRKIPN